MKSKNTYIIPLHDKDLKKAISDPSVHKGPYKHAIDFLIPEGIGVLAAADGIVNRVTVKSSEGGDNKKYKSEEYANYITINHANNEQSRYGHLQHNGSLVKPGEKVKAGQIIGISGNTGYSTEPHLHFEINIDSDNKYGWETVEVVFNKPLIISNK